MASRFTDRLAHAHPRMALDGRAGVPGRPPAKPNKKRKHLPCSTPCSPSLFTSSRLPSSSPSGCSAPLVSWRATGSTGSAACVRSSPVRHQERAKPAHPLRMNMPRDRDTTYPPGIMSTMSDTTLPSDNVKLIMPEMSPSLCPALITCRAFKGRSLGSLAGVAGRIADGLRVGPAAPCSPARGLAHGCRPLRALARFRFAMNAGGFARRTSTVVSLLSSEGLRSHHARCSFGLNGAVDTQARAGVPWWPAFQTTQQYRCAARIAGGGSCIRLPGRKISSARM